MDDKPVFLNPAMGDVERANAELVLNFLQTWDYESYFAPDARIRFESGKQSPIPWDMAKWHCGVGEIIAAAKLYSDMGMTAEVEVRQIHACGPLVVVHRTDHCTLPGTPNRSVRMIGVFLVLNGKIAEWSDFYGNRTPDGEATD